MAKPREILDCPFNFATLSAHSRTGWTARPWLHGRRSANSAASSLTWVKKSVLSVHELRSWLSLIGTAGYKQNPALRRPLTPQLPETCGARAMLRSKVGLKP
jgi:hypothetical protein